MPRGKSVPAPQAIRSAEIVGAMADTDDGESSTLGTTETGSQSKLDLSEEYESRRVPDDALQANLSFATIFAGRHTAAPELVIGPQFVLGGATFGDMVIGCLIGNLLAVLSWRYICAPIAVRHRFSTYYTVKRICGNLLLAVYNILVALVLGGIAGFMFILAANALAIGVGVVDDSYKSPFVITSPGLLFITFLTGMFTTVVAMFGFKVVTCASYWLTPPMFLVIGYLIYAACAELDINISNFVAKMNEEVFTGQYVKGAHYSLAVVALTAFVQDQFCHIGLVDLTMFRFAKTANAGWQSAWGMYLGHFVLWIGAGILYQSQKTYLGGADADLVPGPMAYRLGGLPGLMAILFASWSTANPFLYAGGLGLKSSLSIFGYEEVSSRVVTGTMGLIATLVACFPGLVDFFLQFLQFSGAFLVPVGAIIVVDTYALPRMGKRSEYSYQLDAECHQTNVEAAIAWLFSTTLVVTMILMGMPPYYGPLIGFPLAGGIYALGCHRRPSDTIDCGEEGHE